MHSSSLSLLFFSPHSPLVSPLPDQTSTRTARSLAKSLARQHMIGVLSHLSDTLAWPAGGSLHFSFHKNHKMGDASQKKLKTQNHPKASRTVNVLSVIAHSFCFAFFVCPRFARWSSRRALGLLKGYRTWCWRWRMDGLWDRGWDVVVGLRSSKRKYIVFLLSSILANKK